MFKFEVLTIHSKKENLPFSGFKLKPFVLIINQENDCLFRSTWPTWNNRKILNLPQSCVLLGCLSCSRRRSFLNFLWSIKRLWHPNHNRYHDFALSTYDPSCAGLAWCRVIRGIAVIRPGLIVYYYSMKSKPIKFCKLEGRGQMKEILDFSWRSCDRTWNGCCYNWAYR